MTLKENIIKFALSIGFQDLRFAPFVLLENEVQNYKLWLEKGYNADMNWMHKSIDKREDVSLILENTKSIITLAFYYDTKKAYKNAENTAKISRYAWGSDYHYIIKDKLIEIEKYILSQNPESKSKSYIDTGPILERQWAVKSGLGWQGKNGMIINRKNGSYFFIAVILSTLEFEYDKQDIDRCGYCTKCIDACPTNAIIEPKVIDSNKCISYWTIEAKPHLEIPDEIAKNLQNRIYGCDICQEVCPWNNHRNPIQLDSLFLPRNDETELDLATIENMQQEEFSLRFRKSPIKRTKLDGMKRNIRALLRFRNE